MDRLTIPSSGSLSDSGDKASSPGSPYPPSYYSESQPNLEQDFKESQVDVHVIQFLKTRASTFSTLTGNEVKNKFGKAKRFIMRSGSFQPECPIDELNQNRSYLRQKFSGWRGGVLAAMLSAGSVFMVNLLFTIWAVMKSGSGTNIGLIYAGKCNIIHTTGLWIHIVINILGTVLLGSSNYTMQCLSSPTRKEVDAAHAVGEYVDIGLPSFRNVRGWRKRLMFGFLMVSTLPLHFLWNSAIFTTTQQVDYQVFLVTPEFFNHSSVDCTQNVVTVITSDLANVVRHYQLNSTYSYDFPTGDACSSVNELLADETQGTLQRLSNSECITAYGLGDGQMSKRGNLLVVTKSPLPSNPSATVLLALRYEEFVSDLTGQNWVCDPAYLQENNQKCDWATLAKTADSSWNLGYITTQTGESISNQLVSGEQWPIDYCLSQPIDIGGVCKLEYSLIIMITVLIANLIKFGVIFSFLYTSQEPVLATIGDGIASFLERPDPFTKDRPFLTRHGARRFKVDGSQAARLKQLSNLLWRPFLTRHGARRLKVDGSRAARFKQLSNLLWRHAPIPMRWSIVKFTKVRPLLPCHGRRNSQINESPGPARWKQPKTLRWWHAPSLARWSITLSLCATAIVTVILLLIQANRFLSNPWSQGFGNFNPNDVLSGLSYGSSVSAAEFTSNSILIQMVAVANIPQVLVSCLYFAYNTVYTSMVSADEWSRFTTHRKTLRTTDPVGAQRSTYWLSLPWTYGLPLAAASSLLHWLISQALFVARTEILNTKGEPENISYMDVGFSPLAILISLLFGSGMVVVMIINGSRKLRGGILVANNSLAIAAACQRPENDYNAHLKAVKWGALSNRSVDGKSHCCFTSEEVQPPEPGNIYV